MVSNSLFERANACTHTHTHTHTHTQTERERKNERENDRRRNERRRDSLCLSFFPYSRARLFFFSRFFRLHVSKLLNDAWCLGCLEFRVYFFTRGTHALLPVKATTYARSFFKQWLHHHRRRHRATTTTTANRSTSW